MHRLDLPAVGGGQVSWEFLEPNRLIAHVIEACPQLAEAYARAANECTPTVERPWKLRLCYDEFVPGDKLKAYGTRKSMVLGFNFVELGEDLLSKDHSWFIPNRDQVEIYSKSPWWMESYVGEIFARSTAWNAGLANDWCFSHA